MPLASRPLLVWWVITLRQQIVDRLPSILRGRGDWFTQLDVVALNLRDVEAESFSCKPIFQTFLNLRFLEEILVLCPVVGRARTLIGREFLHLISYTL